MTAKTFSLAVALGLLASACQSGPSRTATTPEAARKVGTTFGGTFIPPPRTIDDILLIFDQAEDSGSQAAASRQADATSPAVARRQVLADFYYKRGLAAGLVGRAQQEIDDLTRALAYARQTFSPLHTILFHLAMAERQGGNSLRTIEHLQE